MAWSIGSSTSRSPIALADPAASHTRGPAPVTDDPPPNRVSNSSPAIGASAMPSGSDNVASAEAGASGTPGVVSAALTTKNSSQQALEQGKVGLAIELGEHAVELDPTDADGWLILGAAYMQRGDNKNARRCFASCVKQATAGAKKECAAMLR
jgi:hypothetical protein